jgi:hypothetical protein
LIRKIPSEIPGAAPNLLLSPAFQEEKKPPEFQKEKNKKGDPATPGCT